MARVLDKLNIKKNPYVKAHGINPEGFPSFQRSLEEAYLQVLLTNTLTGTFYASEHQLLKESLALHGEIADYEFMARALIYARNEGLMRLQPIIGLAFLAKKDTVLFRKIFNRVILTPGDLVDFVEIVRGEVTPGGMGRAVKNAVNSWLNGMSEYHAIKYATGGQGYSLRDVLRVSHPKPINATQDAIFTWLTDREKWLASAEKRALTPQIEAFEGLKKATDPVEARTLIKDGRLPYEIVTGAIKPDADTWVELMRQMPYMALMRHLNTLQRAGVLAEAANADYAVGRLIDEKALRKAKILPFQLFTAYRMFKVDQPAERAVSEALIDAMEAAFVNLPELAGQVCIAPDVSGSMRAAINKMSAVTYNDIAGIFSGALLKVSPKAMVLPFENTVVPIQLSGRDSIMTNVGKLGQIGGGGTAVSAPISELLAKRIKVDMFIGITDNIEWAADQHGNIGFLPTWNEYKRKIAPQAKAFLVTIAPYRHAVAPQDTPDVHYIYGWSDTVLKFISKVASGMIGQVEAVNQIEI